MGLYELRERVGDVHRATLATGTTAPTITVVVTAPAQARTLTQHRHRLRDDADPNAANNTSSATTTVNASADLSIVKTGPATVSPGERQLFAGGRERGSVGRDERSVVDTLPGRGDVRVGGGGGWACTNAGNVSVTCTRPTLAAGTTAPAITVVVTAPRRQRR